MYDDDVDKIINVVDNNKVSFPKLNEHRSMNNTSYNNNSKDGQNVNIYKMQVKIPIDPALGSRNGSGLQQSQSKIYTKLNKLINSHHESSTTTSHM